MVLPDARFNSYRSRARHNDNNNLHVFPFLTPYFDSLGGEWGNALKRYMVELWSRILAITKSPPTAAGRQVIVEWAEQAAGLELVIPAFCMCNLILAPSMPRELWMDIVSIVPPNKEKAYRLVLNYYEKHRWAALESTLMSWQDNPIFGRRMAILKDALSVHKQGKWTLSVPSLLPQIEGISLDIVKRLGLPPDKKAIVIDKNINKEIGKTVPSQVFSRLSIDIFSPREMVAIYTLLYHLEGQLYNWIDLLEEIRQTDELDYLNRHAVLHGAQINYASKINSLRCFLVLDTLQLATKALA